MCFFYKKKKKKATSALPEKEGGQILADVMEMLTTDFELIFPKHFISDF